MAEAMSGAGFVAEIHERHFIIEQLNHTEQIYASRHLIQQKRMDELELGVRVKFSAVTPQRSSHKVYRYEATKVNLLDTYVDNKLSDGKEVENRLLKQMTKRLHSEGHKRTHGHSSDSSDEQRQRKRRQRHRQDANYLHGLSDEEEAHLLAKRSPQQIRLSAWKALYAMKGGKKRESQLAEAHRRLPGDMRYSSVKETTTKPTITWKSRQ